MEDGKCQMENLWLGLPPSQSHIPVPTVSIHSLVHQLCMPKCHTFEHSKSLGCFHCLLATHPENSADSWNQPGKIPPLLPNFPRPTYRRTLFQNSKYSRIQDTTPHQHFGCGGKQNNFHQNFRREEFPPIPALG